MEIIISIAFGVWIAVTALVYRALTAVKSQDRREK